MLQFDAFISCISTLCQNTPGHVLLLFRMCGGRIIGRLLYLIVVIGSRADSTRLGGRYPWAIARVLDQYGESWNHRLE